VRCIWNTATNPTAAMSRSPRLRLIFAPFLAIGVIALLYLGFLALAQAAERGQSETLLMAWMLAFVVGVPTAMLALAAAGAWSSRHPRREILPNTGACIP
jgi:ABC-type transport system involved in cytochrome c biogenesis permease subunit